MCKCITTVTRWIVPFSKKISKRLILVFEANNVADPEISLFPLNLAHCVLFDPFLCGVLSKTILIMLNVIVVASAQIIFYHNFKT